MSVGVGKPALELTVGALPDRNGPGQQRPTRRRQREQAAAPVIRSDCNRHQAAAHQRLERGGERRSIHGKQRGHRSHSRGRGAIERDEQRELAAGQFERPERVVETTGQPAGGTLSVQAQAPVADVPRHCERHITGV